MKIVATALLALFVLMLIFALIGCTLTVHPDGSRSYAADPETIRVLLEK